jgi:hypothetical protein
MDRTFWTLNLDDNLSNLPFRPNLIDILVQYEEVSPSGQWLFERDLRETPDTLQTRRIIIQNRSGSLSRIASWNGSDS